jgi:plasmid stabilization system protein ParE
MRGHRLSPQAELTLEDIIGWTIEHFVIGQAERYNDQLISRLSAIRLRRAALIDAGSLIVQYVNPVRL